MTRCDGCRITALQHDVRASDRWIPFGTNSKISVQSAHNGMTLCRFGFGSQLHMKASNECVMVRDGAWRSRDSLD